MTVGNYKPATHKEFMDYTSVMLFIIILDCLFIIRTARLWLKVYKKLSAVVLSYCLVFVPDIVIAITYLARSIYGLKIGALLSPDSGDYWFCALSAYLTMASCIAFSVGVVCISYTVLRVLQGNPLTPRGVVMWGISGWIIGCFAALIFAANGILGPYKNLYCLVNEKDYRAFGTIPFSIAIFMCFALMVNNYIIAYGLVRKAERQYEQESEFAYTAKASRVVLRNGLTVIGCFYISWFFIFLDAFITAAGGTVPTELDILASLMSKFQPVADSIILHSLLHKMASRYLDNQIVTPAEEGPQQKIRKAIEKYVLRPIKEETEISTMKATGKVGAVGQLV